MTRNNEARGRAALFPRNLHIPPPPPRSRPCVSPERIKEWLLAHGADGGNVHRDTAVAFCCHALGAKRDDVRAVYAETFPDRRGRPQGGGK
jgi:hypothetical protein